MKFLNEEIRREFHLLPVEKQKSIQDADERFQGRGFELFILMVDCGEISLRVESMKAKPKDDCQA